MGKMQGLWARRQGWYISKPISKKELLDLMGDTEQINLILRYNKFYEKDSNRPRFVFSFASVQAADDITEEIQFITAGYIKDFDDGAEYITIDEAIDYARNGVNAIKGGYGAYDVYCSSDLTGETITDIIKRITENAR